MDARVRSALLHRIRSAHSAGSRVHGGRGTAAGAAANPWLQFLRETGLKARDAGAKERYAEWKDARGFAREERSRVGERAALARSVASYIDPALIASVKAERVPKAASARAPRAPRARAPRAPRAAAAAAAAGDVAVRAVVDLARLARRPPIQPCIMGPEGHLVSADVAYIKNPVSHRWVLRRTALGRRLAKAEAAGVAPA